MLQSKVVCFFLINCNQPNHENSPDLENAVFDWFTYASAQCLTVNNLHFCLFSDQFIAVSPTGFLWERRLCKRHTLLVFFPARKEACLQIALSARPGLCVQVCAPDGRNANAAHCSQPCRTLHWTASCKTLLLLKGVASWERHNKLGAEDAPSKLLVPHVNKKRKAWY